MNGRSRTPMAGRELVARMPISRASARALGLEPWRRLRRFADRRRRDARSAADKPARWHAISASTYGDADDGAREVISMT